MSYYSSVILADTPQAYYRLNDSSGTTALDSSGHGYNATLSGTFTLSQTGAIYGDADNSISFDGTTGTISLPYTLNYTAWTAFSLEFWTTASGSVWEHVAVTYSSGTTTVYRNGVAYTPDATAPVEISQIFAWAGSYVSCKLDEIAVYNYALTSSQILHHYQIVYTRSIAVRTLVRTQVTKSARLRALVATKKSLSSVLRTPVRTLRTLSVAIRAPVRTLKTVSSAMRTRVRTQATQTTALRSLVRTQRTLSTGLRSIVKGITKLAPIRISILPFLLPASDTFTRANTTASTTISTGWGAASDTESWSSAGASYTWQIQSNEGTATGTTGQSIALLGSSITSNTDATVRFEVSNSGDAAGIVLCYTDSNNYYRCRVTATQVLFDKVSGGTVTNLASATVTRSANTFYKIRARVINGNVYANFWSGSSEPTGWTATAVDSTPLVAGKFGLFINLNSAAHIASFDSFKVTMPAVNLSIRVLVRTQHALSLATRTLVSTQHTLSLAMRTLVRTQHTLSLVMRTLVRSQVSKSALLRALVRTQRTLTTSLRTIVFSQGNKSTVFRTLVRSQKTVSIPLRALVRTQQTLSTGIRAVIRGVTRLEPIRVLVRTQKILSLATRALVRTQITRSLQTRIPVRVQTTKSVVVRFPVSTKITKSLQIRIPIRTQVAQTVPLRVIVSLVSTLVSKSLPVRIVIRTQKIVAASIRTLVRTQKTFSLAARILVRAQKTLSLATRALVRTQHTLSTSLRTLVRTQHTLSTGIRSVVRGITKATSIRTPVKTFASKITVLRTLVRTGQTLSSSLRTLVRTQVAKSTGIRTLTRTQRNLTTQLRTLVKTQFVTRVPLRVLIRTQRSLSTSIRTVIRGITKTTSLRVPVRTLISQSTPIRALVRTQHVLSTPVRSLVRTLRSRSAPLRTVVATQVNRSTKIRAMIRTQHILVTNLRIVVRSVGTLVSRSSPLRILVRTQIAKSASLRTVVRGITKVISIRIPVSFTSAPTSTVINSTLGSACNPASAPHSWILPDGSLILAYNASTNNTFGGTNFQNMILIQSNNWTTRSPIWDFVKQIGTTNLFRVACWWDAANGILHCITSANASTGGAVTYIAGTYTQSGGIWNWAWGSSSTIVSSGASNAIVLVDGSSTIWVAYRNVSGTTFSVQMIANVSGTWQTPFQISSTTSTSSGYGMSMAIAGSNTVCTTFENGTCYAAIHPNGTNYHTGWGTMTASSNMVSMTFPATQYGSICVFSDSSSSCWVSASSTSGTSNVGLFVQRFTFSGTTVTWSSSSFANLDATGSANSGASSGTWTSLNNNLYLFYFRQTANNVSDVYYFYFSLGVWSTASYNLTNASASNNIIPVVPITGITTNIPIIYEHGTVAPFPLSLLVLPIVQRSFVNRLALASITINNKFAHRLIIFGQKSHKFFNRLALSARQQLEFMSRLRISTTAPSRYWTNRLRTVPLQQWQFINRLVLSIVVNRLSLPHRINIASSSVRDKYITRLRVSSFPRSKKFLNRIKIVSFFKQGVVLHRLALASQPVYSQFVNRLRLVFLPNIKQLINRLVLSGPTSDLLAMRLVFWGLGQSKLVNRLVFFGAQQLSFLSRLRLSGGGNHRHRFINRLVIHAPFFVPPASSLQPSPIGYMGMGITPTLPPVEPYTVNGIVLPTQPTVTTAPLTLSGRTVTAGSTFILGFVNVDTTTNSLLLNGSTITMQFTLADGTPVTGPVSITTMTNNGVTLQVLCRTLADISMNKPVILTQFP